MLTLRPYQRAALDGLFTYWHEEGGNGLVVVPTGGGKSLILAQICQELLADWPDMRLAIVTHVKELIAQNYQELLTVWPWAPAGIYSAGLGRRETQAQILFGGIQSVWNKVGSIGHVDLLLIDEAHLIPRKSDTMYGKFIDGLRAVNPDMRVAGLTATPYRLDSGRLDRGDDRLFDGIVYEVSIRDLMDEGYLSPLISKATATTLDVTGVAKRGGEYIPGELQKAVDKDDVTRAAVDEIMAYGLAPGAERRSWLLFCSGVEHAYHVRNELRRRGITAETVEGSLHGRERDRIIDGFRRGEFRALTNMSITTTGFNVPQVDLLAMLRPTLSTGLYVQIVGRATRLAEGKSNALILDFAGNVRRHGPVDAVTPKEPGKGDGEAPVKACPDCHSLVHTSVMVCPDCGHVWERKPLEEKINARADAAPILSKGAPEWVRVVDWQFHQHQKPGSPPSMRVEYFCGLTVHREWICLEHDGYPKSKAWKWWMARGGEPPIPDTVAEAIERHRELVKPNEIRVRPSGKYWEIVGYRPLVGVPA